MAFSADAECFRLEVTPPRSFNSGVLNEGASHRFRLRSDSGIEWDFEGVVSPDRFGPATGVFDFSVENESLVSRNSSIRSAEEVPAPFLYVFEDPTASSPSAVAFNCSREIVKVKRDSIQATESFVDAFRPFPPFLSSTSSDEVSLSFSPNMATIEPTPTPPKRKEKKSKRKKMLKMMREVEGHVTSGFRKQPQSEPLIEKVAFKKKIPDPSRPRREDSHDDPVEDVCAKETPSSRAKEDVHGMTEPSFKSIDDADARDGEEKLGRRWSRKKSEEEDIESAPAVESFDRTDSFFAADSRHVYSGADAKRALKSAAKAAARAAVGAATVKSKSTRSKVKLSLERRHWGRSSEGSSGSSEERAAEAAGVAAKKTAAEEMFGKSEYRGSPNQSVDVRPHTLDPKRLGHFFKHQFHRRSVSTRDGYQKLQTRTNIANDNLSEAPLRSRVSQLRLNYEATPDERHDADAAPSLRRRSSEGVKRHWRREPSPSSEVAPPQTPQPPLNLDAQKRRLVLKELVQTERDYVKNLAILCENIMAKAKTTTTTTPHSNSSFKLRPSNKSSITVTTPPSAKVAVVFGNIHAIYDFHRLTLLPELENCVSVHRIGSQPLNLRQVFFGREGKRLERLQHLYNVYCENKFKSDAVVNQFEGFFEKLRVDLNLRLKVKDLLIQPVQRITRYPLLLKEVVKYTEKLGEDHAPLKDTLSILERLPKSANDMMEAGKLLGFQGSVTAQGKLLRSAKAEVAEMTALPVCGAASAASFVRRHTFLFEQTIIVAEIFESEDGNEVQYLCRRQIKTNKMALVVEERDEASGGGGVDNTGGEKEDGKPQKEDVKEAGSDDMVVILEDGDAAAAAEASVGADAAEPRFIVFRFPTQQERQGWVEAVDEILATQHKLMKLLQNPTFYSRRKTLVTDL